MNCSGEHSEGANCRKKDVSIRNSAATRCSSNRCSLVAAEMAARSVALFSQARSNRNANAQFSRDEKASANAAKKFSEKLPKTEAEVTEAISRLSPCRKPPLLTSSFDAVRLGVQNVSACSTRQRWTKARNYIQSYITTCQVSEKTNKRKRKGSSNLMGGINRLG